MQNLLIIIIIIITNNNIKNNNMQAERSQHTNCLKTGKVTRGPFQEAVSLAIHTLLLLLWIDLWISSPPLLGLRSCFNSISIHRANSRATIACQPPLHTLQPGGECPVTPVG